MLRFRREAADRAESKGLPVAVLFPEVLNPLPDRAIEEFLGRVKVVVVPEVNSMPGRRAGAINREMRPGRMTRKDRR